VQDIKKFLEIASRDDVKVARIKKTVLADRTVQTKFKLRASRFLYTLVVNDVEKAEKLKQSLPPSMYQGTMMDFLTSAATKVEEIGAKRLK
jgi:ribosomal L38e protein family